MSFDTSNSHDTVTSMQERLIDSDTSADELALDYPSPIPRTKRQKVQTRLSTPRSTRGEPRSMREESRSTQEYFLPSEGIRAKAAPSVDNISEMKAITTRESRRRHCKSGKPG
jgi:hypothetical protein